MSYDREASKKTAISRWDYTRAMKIVLKSGLFPDAEHHYQGDALHVSIEATTHVLDYGCGRSKDAFYLWREGYAAVGYDPYHNCWSGMSLDELYHQVEQEGIPFDAITCFYVLNVLPTVEERLEVLEHIYNLVAPEGIVFIAARPPSDVNSQVRDTWTPYNDGWITSRGTFQKGIDALELVELLEMSGADDMQVIKRNPAVVAARYPLNREEYTHDEYDDYG